MNWEVQLPPHMRAALEHFAQSAAYEYPPWSPSPGVWSSSDTARLNALRIPKTTDVGGRESHPDSVLYGLGRLEVLDPCFPNRLAQFLEGQDHLLLVNVSGSGKTKLVLEALYQNWGLFFTAWRHSISDPYGSGDVWAMLRSFRAHARDQAIPLPKKPNGQPPAELLENRALIARGIDGLILARLVILDRLLELVSAAGLSEENARRKWFYLQLRSADIIGMDIFEHSHFHMRSLPRAECDQLLQTLLQKHSSKLALVAIDEAQALCLQYQTAFSSTDMTRFRSLLGEMLVCLASRLQRSRLIACGVQIDEDMFSDAIAGSTSSIRSYRSFSSLGRFADLEDVRHYMVHFLGDRLPARYIELAHRWFRGRRRFLAVLVHRTLLYGIKQYLTVFDSILKDVTGWAPGVSSNRHLLVWLDIVLSDEFLEVSPFAALLRAAAYRIVVRNDAPVYRQHAARLVGISTGWFVDNDMDTTQIDEPLILLNIARWLKTSPQYSTAAIIRQRLKDPATELHGCGFSEAFALFLWRRFGASGLRLTDLVSFKGRAPRWASQAAPFALLHMDGEARQAVPLKKLGGALAYAANDADDVFGWFERSTVPFLIPDNDFGPQLVFVLDALDGPRLVFVHLEPFPGRARPHRQDYVKPCVPARYYATKRAAHKRFQRVLESFSSPGDPRSKTTRNVAYNTLQIYAFAEVQRSFDADRAPAATLRLDVVLGEDSDSEREEDDPARWLELRPEDIGSPIR